MEDSRLQLRGHHIGVLALYYDLAKDNQLAYDHMNNILTVMYGDKIQNYFASVFTSLQDNPKLQVEIANGLDSICMIGCPRQKSSCSEVKSYDEDTHTLNTYDLTLGGVYTAKELLLKIKDFKHRFRIGSTRQVQVAAMAFETY